MKIDSKDISVVVQGAVSKELNRNDKLAPTDIDYSKKCILTPTFSGHFSFIEKYLKSFDKYVEDKEKCIIYFVISKNEAAELEKILRRFKRVNATSLFLEDVLNKFNISESCDEILNKYTRYSYQAIKKFYSMLYLKDYKRFLVLDSETMWVRKTNIEKMFDDFFKNPKIYYSDSIPREEEFKNVPNSNSALNRQTIDNVNYLLNDPKNNKWFVEQFMRFWCSDILEDIIQKHGTFWNMVLKISKRDAGKISFGLFESVLYDQFIYNNNDKYGYELVNIDRTIEKYLSNDEISKYKHTYDKMFLGGAGLYEHFALFLDKDNVSGFSKYYIDNNINIVRIENSERNYKYQNIFMKMVKPNILTCSQGHLFGVNSTFFDKISKLCKIEKKLRKLNKNLKTLFLPLEWFRSLILSIFYIFEILVKIAFNFWRVL